MSASIVDAVKSWKVRTPRGGAKVVMTYPFIFLEGAPAEVTRTVCSDAGRGAC